jgi:hypothetical protein
MIARRTFQQNCIEKMVAMRQHKLQSYLFDQPGFHESLGQRIRDHLFQKLYRRGRATQKCMKKKSTHHCMVLLLAH